MAFVRSSCAWCHCAIVSAAHHDRWLQPLAVRFTCPLCASMLTINLIFACRNADQVRKPSRSGRPQGCCPWAQDDDSNQFQRGPPSSRGARGVAANMGPNQGPPRTSYKPQGSAGTPWASDDPTAWDKPANAYGAGLAGGGAPCVAPTGGYDDEYEQDDYCDHPPPCMPVRQPMKAVQPVGRGAPWAVDDGEPMMSVSQAAYRGGGSRGGGAPPSSGSIVPGGPALSAKEMKAKMQGAGNLLSWN